MPTTRHARRPRWAQDKAHAYLRGGPAVCVSCHLFERAPGKDLVSGTYVCLGRRNALAIPGLASDTGTRISVASGKPVGLEALRRSQDIHLILAQDTDRVHLDGGPASVLVWHLFERARHMSHAPLVRPAKLRLLAAKGGYKPGTLPAREQLLFSSSWPHISFRYSKHKTNSKNTSSSVLVHLLFDSSPGQRHKQHHSTTSAHHINILSASSWHLLNHLTCSRASTTSRTPKPRPMAKANILSSPMSSGATSPIGQATSQPLLRQRLRRNLVHLALWVP